MRRAGRFHDDQAHDAPDFRTIADFRKRHLPLPLGRLFLLVLMLGEKAGLAKLGHVGGSGRHEGQGERLQTQGDERRTHENA